MLKIVPTVICVKLIVWVLSRRNVFAKTGAAVKTKVEELAVCISWDLESLEPFDLLYAHISCNINEITTAHLFVIESSDLVGLVAWRVSSNFHSSFLFISYFRLGEVGVNNLASMGRYYLYLV